MRIGLGAVIAECAARTVRHFTRVQHLAQYPLDEADNKLLGDFSAVLEFRRLKSFERFGQYGEEHASYGVKNTKSALEIELMYENTLAHTDDTNQDNQLVCQPGPKADTLTF
jgi:hypothetical protein